MVIVVVVGAVLKIEKILFFGEEEGEAQQPEKNRRWVEMVVFFGVVLHGVVWNEQAHNKTK